MSILSMLFPSPDWIVGVSALELCLKNCSWVTEKVMNLYLWDAGTDSGTTYLSPKKPTIPQERIHRITSTTPNLANSPFYDPNGGRMKPFARLTVSRQRIYEKLCGENSTFYYEEEDTRSEHLKDIHLDSFFIFFFLLSDDCKVTEWTVFGPCSVSCGEGIRKRTRNYMYERAKESNCNMKLVEKEKCGAKCINNVSCETTSWSEWSPCNVTCGKGIRTRTRKFLHRMARKLCNTNDLMQTEPCVGPLHNCADAQISQNPSSCTGPFCSDTENEMCSVTNWSEWSPCIQKCGKGFKIRSRVYTNPYASKNVCNISLIQSLECIGEPCPVQIDAQSKW